MEQSLDIWRCGKSGEMSPPESDRGMGGRSFCLSGRSVSDYAQDANNETVLIVMIEDLDAVNNLVEILSV